MPSTSTSNQQSPRSLSIEAIDLAQNEMLLVAFHPKTKKWWASIGPAKGAQRAVGQGVTAIGALGDVLIDLGHRPTNSE